MAQQNDKAAMIVKAQRKKKAQPPAKSLGDWGVTPIKPAPPNPTVVNPWRKGGKVPSPQVYDKDAIKRA